MVNKFIKKYLLKKIKEQSRKLDAQGLYSVFTSKCFLEQFEQIDKTSDLIDFYNIGKECDDKYPVIRGTGKLLESFTEDKNITLAIRVNESDELQSNMIKKSISKGVLAESNGLYFYDKPLLNDSLLFPKNMIDLLNILKQDQKGKFLIKFPCTYVNGEGHYKINNYYNLFNVFDEKTYIKPEFIDSYIVSNQGVINRITKNSLENNLVKKIKPTE